MADPTPVEIEAGAEAIAHHVRPPEWAREVARAVLRAVLPDHDARMRTEVFDDAHTTPNQMTPGLYPADPQGHAYVAGTNGRSLTVLDTHSVIDIAGVHVTDPEVLDQLGDRLKMLAGRLRSRAEAAIARQHITGEDT